MRVRTWFYSSAASNSCSTLIVLAIAFNFLTISPALVQETERGNATQERAIVQSAEKDVSQKGFFGRIMDERRRRKEERRAAAKERARLKARDETEDKTFSTKTRTELIGELKGAKKELEKREFRIEAELAEAKEELRRRQADGEITAKQVRLTPANIRDQQLSELEKLKAELARRQATNTTKQERIGRALSNNELAYRYVDRCITRADGNFNGVFSGRPELELVVEEKKNRVYRNSDRSVLLQTTPDTCDVSFSGGDMGDYTAGLVHILETQGGLVETKNAAGLTIIHTVHPRGNFRLATGRKVIGNAGTNLYTTVNALQ